MPWEAEEEREAEAERRRRRGSRRDRPERDEELRLDGLVQRARELREELERIESDIERLAVRRDEGSRS
jgi:hypothetical protein